MPPHHRRLAQLRAQLGDPSAIAPVPSADSAPESVEGLPPKLLTDLQMRQFVSDGWLALPVDEMPDLHAELHAAAQKMWEMNGEANGGSVGNNVYPALPQLQTVFDGPTVNGALTSLLGADYRMEAHRFMHTSSVGGTQQLHKDSQRGKPSMHRPRRCFVFYYPGGATREMGCTALVRHSHLLSADKQDWADVNADATSLGPACEELPITTPPRVGTAVLAHHGIVHRAMGRLIDHLDDETGDHPWRPCAPHPALLPAAAADILRLLTGCSSSSSNETRSRLSPNGTTIRRACRRSRR